MKYPARPLSSAGAHCGSGVDTTSLAIPDTGSPVVLTSETRAVRAKGIGHHEDNDTDPSGFKQIDKEKVTATIDKINSVLKDKQITSKVRQKLNYARKNWPAALASTQQERVQEEMILADLDPKRLACERSLANYMLRTRRPELFAELVREQVSS